MKEDPDAQCTSEQIFWGKAEGESKIRGFRSHVIINYGTQTEGKRVIGEATEIGSKPESQSDNNHRKTNKQRSIKIQRQDLLDRDRKPETGSIRMNRKQEPGNTNLTDELDR